MADDAAGLAKDMAAVKIENEELSSSNEADERKRRQEDELDALLEEIHRRNKGSIFISLFGPTRHSARATARSWWADDDSDLCMSVDEEARAKGFVTASHPSFGLYRRRRFYTKPRAPLPMPSDEDTILLDVEAEAKYDHVYGGTVSVEGFGMEWWDWEENFGPARQQIFQFSRGIMPPVKSVKMLRRTDELARANVEEDGEERVDDGDLMEFFGDEAFAFRGGRTYNSTYLSKLSDCIRSLYSILNREDVFVDFSTRTVFSLEQVAAEEQWRGMNVWDLFFQMIAGQELARLLEKLDLGSADGMTPRVLASVLIADTWFRGSKVEHVDWVVDFASFKKEPGSARDEDDAEKLRHEAEQLALQGWHDEAVETYTKAIMKHPHNPTTWLQRGLSFEKLGDMTSAREDAYAATRLDPRNANAWAQLGAAEMGFGNWERAKDAYGRAADLAGPNFVSMTGSHASTTMQRGVDMAQAHLESEAQELRNATDPLEKKRRERLALERAWDPTLKSMQIRSKVHERQVEGLMHFAERLQWPYLEELRGYATKAYAEFLSGGQMLGFVHDWLYGLTLPGRWMALKLMGTMILCTPSTKEAGPSFYFDSGVVVEGREGREGESCSYWRSRTALGRILAPLPGVVSLCGWVGRCPAVEMVSSTTSTASTTPPAKAESQGQKKLLHVRIKAEKTVPITMDLESDEAMAYSYEYATRLTSLSILPGEDRAAYLAAMHDPTQWVVPRPKAHVQTATPTRVKLQGIRLTRLPWTAERQRTVANGTFPKDEAEVETQYEASISFRVGGPGPEHERTISHTIRMNPLLISLPSCKRPEGAEGHAVHEREREQYEVVAWPVDRLGEYDGEAEKDGKVLVIDARGAEAEVMARAWCAEKGRHAVVWRDACGADSRDGDGTEASCCYTCAVRAAGRGALYVCVVIWTF
ncbi:hypothetical protein SODALDRAFT_333972 [Sodiomyces alkalinus F11]|uniref:Uncharacterized protein n=1 Tax=Sodiomyces alkalinus (strain CBS 110278 / VKM F-3762 / F11) TaxID=1314773 RepID=A0A3N2PUP5_SODAK|nr:hypothetical protein SODALDRAFT_333972 [Sodiomyces alkalinus F11]ROT38200.1 hypothetical protein SODALDRAFT_333972 [Sodiomyces alkalinus F11]